MSRSSAKGKPRRGLIDTACPFAHEAQSVANDIRYGLPFAEESATSRKDGEKHD
jgi:hypothetical protein